jgi:hypothetical protein
MVGIVMAAAVGIGVVVTVLAAGMSVAVAVAASTVVGISVAVSVGTTVGVSVRVGAGTSVGVSMGVSVRRVSSGVDVTSCPRLFETFKVKNINRTSNKQRDRIVRDERWYILTPHRHEATQN